MVTYHAGNQLSFINILDLASISGVVAIVPSKHAEIVWDHFSRHWVTPFGVLRRLIYDQREECEREFGQELEEMGCELMPTAAITPFGCWQMSSFDVVSRWFIRKSKRFGVLKPSAQQGLSALMDECRFVNSCWRPLSQSHACTELGRYVAALGRDGGQGACDEVELIKTEQNMDIPFLPFKMKENVEVLQISPEETL